MTIDAKWLLQRIQQIEYTLDEIRTHCGQGAFVTPKTGEININDIEWLKKVGEPTGFNASWAWAFAYDQDGSVLDEAQAIVTALLHEDKVKVGQYEISWGGRDKDLLSRKIPKTKERPQR